MADETERGRPPKRRPAEDERQSPRRRSPDEAAGIARAAGEQLEELLARPVTGIVGLERSDDGWEVTLEVVELERVPETTSILGCYAVTLSDEGELQGYRRLRRYARSQVQEG